MLIQGKSGSLEVAIDEPKVNQYSNLNVVICHPHPLYQGTMHNKVVTTIARAFKEIGVRCIRFNFRGIGASNGSYDNGVGEIDDVISVIHWVQKKYETKHIILSGFSFGGAMAYRAAGHVEGIISLCTVAPAVVNFPLDQYMVPNVPWLVIQGVDDEVVSAQSVFECVLKDHQSNTALIKLDGVGHFFHGNLILLKNELQFYYKERLKKWLI